MILHESFTKARLFCWTASATEVRVARPGHMGRGSQEGYALGAVTTYRRGMPCWTRPVDFDNQQGIRSA